MAYYERKNKPRMPGMMGYLTRIFLLALTVAGIAIAVSIRGSDSAGADDGPIKIGLLENQTGNFAAFGLPKYHAAVLAVKELNDRGGLLRRKVDLVAVDVQSDTNRIVSLARILLDRDKVDVLMGGGPSSDREALRPLVRARKLLYFYNTAYEGGVCDSWTFNTGLVPEQGFAPLVEFMTKKYGPRVYNLAPDYVWGHLGTQQLELYAKRYGATIVGNEFIPLDVSDFSSSLSRIEQSKADWIMLLITGEAQSSFFKQRTARGIKTPMADFVIVVGQQGLHRRVDPPVLAGMHETVSYVEELPGERNATFVKHYRAMWPTDVYITEEAQYAYLAIHLWAKAVELAGTTDSAKVIKTLETGVKVSAPEGEVAVDGTNHHLSHPVYLIQVTEDHKVKILNQWGNVAPAWLHDKCDLTKKPDQTQYSPLTK